MPDLELQPHQRARADRMVRILELTSRLSYAAVVTPDPDIIAPFVRAVIASACQPGLELRVRWIGWTGLTETTNEIESMMNEQSNELRIVIVDLSQVRQESLADARNFAARINLRRDPFARRFVGLLMLCLPDWLEIPLASAAPDLWSVMTVEHLERTVELGTALDEWWTECDCRFDEVVASHPDGATRYQHGTCTFAYVIEPGRMKLPLADLRDHLATVPGHTNWRPWWVPTDSRAPVVFDGAMECWMIGPQTPLDRPARADFWRAVGSGKLYLRRGHDEDSNSGQLPIGTAISTSVPLVRCAEAILHARDFGRLSNLHENTRVELRVRWTGLDGRTLTTWPNNDPFDDVLRHRSRTPEVSNEIEFTIDQIDDELASLVERLTTPLFESFDFYRSPPAFIAKQVADFQ